jgi:hypothetical protein
VWWSLRWRYKESVSSRRSCTTGVRCGIMEVNYSRYTWLLLCFCIYGSSFFAKVIYVNLFFKIVSTKINKRNKALLVIWPESLLVYLLWNICVTDAVFTIPSVLPLSWLTVSHKTPVFLTWGNVNLSFEQNCIILNMLLMILNGQNNSLLYWIGLTCTSYESFLIVWFLLFVNIDHQFVSRAMYNNYMPFMYFFNVTHCNLVNIS